jgi:RNA 3'-terminal phosphate cyclase (ATP)
MIQIDGSLGEGGGQVLRTALALALVTGQPFRLEKIRAGRAKPGLLRQHLTAVQAAARIGAARVEGAVLGSTSLVFEPGAIRPGNYHFDIGTAGSTTLVLQTILPPLLAAGGPSRLTLVGGTHNGLAPPFDFLARTFLPLLNRLGPAVAATLERPGFFPAGGGRLTAEIQPAPRLSPLCLGERGALRQQWARVLIAGLPPAIAERECQVLRQKLGWPEEC